MKQIKSVLLVLVLLCFASMIGAQNNRAVNPLIQPVWHQTDPWNARCPGTGTNRANAGSHALAMAKVMKYWAYPTYGVGSNTYTDDDYGVLTQDFTPEIMWDNMSNDLVFQTTLRFIFKVGVACNTNYEVDYSTSTLANVQNGLLNYFTYDSDMVYRTREGNTNFYWKSLIRTELDNNRPVLYSAVLSNGNEVAFIIDGYDDDGLFHINWSDLNYPDGYVDLNTFTVHGQIISNANQHMLTGVKPSDGPPNIDESFETDFSHFNWQFSGNANWTISTEAAYYGSQSAKSGNIMANQSTSMFISINVTAADHISFYKKVSCEAEPNNLYDHLAFFIDNVEQERWSGNGSWAYHQYPVTAGVHEFRWTYSKDGASTYFSDCAWVDGVDFPAGTTPLRPARFVEAEVINNNSIQVNWSVPEGSLTSLLGYRVFRNGTQVVQYNSPSQTSHTDFNMPNGDYTYFIRAVYQQGISGDSNIATATVEVPYAPENLTAALIGVDTVELTWTAPPLLRDRSMMGYQVYRDDVLIAQIENPEATSYQDPGLSEGVYFYQVSAMYGVGESARSNTAQIAVGVPEPPSNVHATVSTDDVTLTWNQVPDTTFLTGFKVFRNGVMVHEITNPTQLQYVDQNLRNGAYSYYMKAVYGDQDSGNSATVNVIVEVPYPPANPSATVVNGINVQVRWTNPETTRTLTQYRVYRDGALIAAIFNPNILLYLDQDLPNATYTYTITAIYSGVESQPSTPVTALIEVLYPPTNMTAAVTLADVQLNWVMPINHGGLRTFNGYNVYRNDVLLHYISGSTNLSYRDVNAPNGLYHYDVTAVYTTGESAPVTASNVLVEVLYPPTNLTYTTSDDDITLHWTAAATQPSGREGDSRAFITYNIYKEGVLYATSTTINYTDSNQPNGFYHYYVTALYGTGESIPTNAISLELEVPYPPQNLVATVNDDDVTLNWTAPVNSGGLNRVFVNYQIFRDNVWIYTTTNLTYVDNNLPNNTYQYYVEAIYQNHTSAPSNVATILVEVLYPARNLARTVTSHNNVNLSWTAPLTSGGLRDLTGYQIYRNEALLTTVTGRTYTDSALPDGNYTYYVRAVYGSGIALPSNSVIARIEYPYPPTNVQTSVNSDDVTITWNAVPGTTLSYRLYRNGVLIASVAGLTYTDSNLANGVYSYYLTSHNTSDSGYSEHSTTVTATVEVLYPATNLTYLVTGDDVALTWVAPVTSGGLRNFLGYTVYRDAAQIAVITSLTYLDANLANGTYHYYVVANYSSGNAAPSNMVNVLVEVHYPATALTYSVNADAVTLNWTAAVTSGGLRNLEGYQIYRNGTLLVQTANLTYLDSGLTNGVYSYYVTAVYGTGNSTPSNTVTAIVEVLYPPSNLTYAHNDDAVVLSWNAAQTSGGLRNFLGYKIYRDNVVINQVTSLTYTDNGLTNGFYNYRVTALYNSGESTPTNTVNVEVQVLYPATNLTYSVNADDVTLNWNAAAISGGLRTFTGYKVYRNNALITQTTALTYLDANLANGLYSYHIVATYAGGDAAPTPNVNALVEVLYPAANLTYSVNADAVTLNWTAANTSGGLRSFIGYKIYRNNVSIAETTNLTYTNTALANGVYSYYVKAHYGTGESTPTNTVTATIEVHYPATALTYNLVDDDVTLLWTAAANAGGLRNLLGYTIYKDNVQIGQTTALTYADLNLANGTYGYYVIANYTSGNSNPSNTVNVLVEVHYPATALTYSVNADNVTLNWTAAVISGGLRNFQGYKIYRNGTMVTQTMNVTYLDAGLANGVYSYYVVAAYGTGNSAPSNTVTATVELLYPPSNLTYLNDDDDVVLNWTAAAISGGLRSFTGYKIYRDNVVIAQVTSLTYRDAALTNGFYDYRVTALYSTGESTPTNTVHVEVQVLYPATNITYSVNTDDVTLNWTAAAINGGLRSFVGYKVYRDNVQIAMVNTLTYLDANLANAIYNYHIVASYQGGDATPTPDVSVLVEVLYPASNLTYSVNADAVTLNWNAAPTSGRSFLGYKVYRDGSLITQTTNLTYTDPALANGVYSYYVTAQYGTGESAPTNTVVATVEVLYPATALTYSVLDDDVTLNWVAAATSGGLRNMLGYTIYRDNVQIGQTTNLTYNDLNLTNGIYNYYVTANYTSGNSTPTNTVEVLVEVLYPATALTYSVDADNVTLNWTAAAVSGGLLRSFEGYKIYRDGTEIAQTTGITYLDSHLTNGVYSYYVVAVYSTGVSTPSNTVTATVEVLYPPSNLTYTNDDDAVILNWTAAPISGGLRSFIGYKVYRDDAVIAQVTDLTYTDIALTNGFYDYKVTALYNAGESTPTNTVHVEVEVLYPATNLTYSVNADDVTLNWNAAAVSGGLRSFVGYKVYRDNAQIAQVTDLTYLDANLANAIYNYYIVASYQGGDSTPTTAVDVLVEVLYPASNLTFTVNADAVTLNWNAAPTSGRAFNNYKVYRDGLLITETTDLTYTDMALANGVYAYYVTAQYGTGESVPTNTVTAIVEVLYPATALTYNVLDDDVTLNWTAAATSGGLRNFLGYTIFRDNTQIGQTTELNYTDAYLTNGIYNYYVTANYTSGNSTQTNTVEVLVEVLYPATALTYSVNADAVTLNWTAAVSGGLMRSFEGYKIFRDGTEIAQTTGVTYLDSGLTNGVYNYYVVAVYGTGAAAPSNTVTATVEVLYPPSNLTYLNDDDAVILNWTAAPVAGGLRSFLGYKVYRNDAEIAQVTDLTYIDNALTNGFYDYKVTAIYNAGESTPTNTVHVEVEVLYPAANLTYIVNADDVTLNWTAAAVSGGLRSFVGYKVYRDNAQIGLVTDVTYLDSNLANGIYNYYIVTSYQGGDAIPTTAVDVLVEVLYPASNLTYSVNADAVTLNWTAAPVTGRAFIGYKVYRDNNVITETTNLTFTDPALANGVYNYYVTAHYGTGESTPTNTVTAIVEILYPATSLSYSVNGDDVTLNWVAPLIAGGLRNLLGFSIFRDNVMIGQTTNLNYTDLNLSNGTYNYYVTTNYTSGNSTPTNTVEVLVEVLYPATALTYSVDRDNVTLNWIDAAISGGLRNFQGYKIFRDGTEIAQIPGTTYLDAGLLNGIYSYNVVAVYSTGVSAPSNTVVATVEVLYPPANLTYSVTGDDVTLNWVAPANTDRQFLGFEVYRNDAPIAVLNGVEYHDNNLANGIYQYTVKALYNAGYSEASNAVLATVEVPYGVTQLTAQVDQDNVTLTWILPATSGTRSFQGYFIYRNGILHEVLNTPGATSWIDHGLANGDYAYSITAVYDAGLSAPSNVVNVTIYVAPTLNPPTELVATVVNERDVNLVWNAPVGDVLSYKVYREAIQVTEITGTTWTDVALPNGSFNYYVKAQYAAGLSSASNTVTANIMIANAPTNFNAQIHLGNNVLLTWTAPALGEIGYIIYRNNTELAYISDGSAVSYLDQNLANGTYSYQLEAVYVNVVSVPTPVVTVSITQTYDPHNLALVVNQSQVTLTWSAPQDLGGFITYRIYRNSTNHAEAITPGYVDNNVPNGTYNYFVTAVYETGESFPTTTQAAVIQVTYPPTALTAIPTGTSVALSWNAAADLGGFVSYKVWRNNIFIATSLIPSYNDTGLANGIYAYYVQTVYSFGMSLPSNVATTQVTQTYAPQTASAIATNNNVMVSWTAPVDTSFLSLYRIYRNEVLLGETTSLSYADNNLANANYHYQVLAMYGTSASALTEAGTVHIEMIYQPSNPIVIVTGDAVQFSWNAVSDPGFLIQYKVYRDNLMIGSTNNLTYAQSGLANGTYAYQVSAQYGAGESNRTATATAFVELHYPATALAYSISNDDVTLSWTAAAVSGGLRNFLGYKVYRNSVLINQVMTTTFTDINLANGVYQYYVVASYTTGEAAPTNTVTANIELQYPATGLTYTVTSDDVQLNWTAAAASGGLRSFIDYQVFRNNVQIAETTNLGYADLSLDNGKYAYYVKAHYSTGISAPSNSVVAAVQVAYPPRNATQVTVYNHVTISWQAPEDTYGLTTYVVNRNGVFYASTTTLSFDDYFIPNGSYTYRIDAVYANGQTASSNLVTANVLVAYAPRNLAASVSTNIVSLNWIAPVQTLGFTSYKIYRNGSLIQTQTGLTYNDIGLANGNYTYYVKAMFGANESPASATVEAAVSVTYPAQNVIATFVTGTTEAMINWTAPAGGPSFNSFSVWFLVDGQQDNPTLWVNVIDGITNTTISDLYHGGLAEGNFRWAVITNYDNGNSQPAFSNILTYTGNEDNHETAVTQLKGNYPNPFNPETRIAFSLKAPMQAQLLVYNSKGQVVKTLANGLMDAGDHTITWHGDNDNGQTLGSGIYFYRLITPDYTKTGKAIMMK